MTALLVSVRDADEARDAVEAGADLIDIKEPRGGSLGAATLETIALVVRVVAGRRPISIALGELSSGAVDLQVTFGGDDYAGGIQFAKIGLAGCAVRTDWADEWQRALGMFHPGTSPVAVVYADWRAAQAPAPDAVIEHGQRLGCGAMLIDTFDKGGPGLLGLWSISDLKKSIGAARSADMLVVLGGQVTEKHLPAVLQFDSDYIAVRGAVCRGDRAARLDPARVRQFKHQLNTLQRIGI